MLLGQILNVVNKIGMNTQNLETYVNQLLQVSLFQDYAPNGLQIEGVSEVSKIATAVTASLDVIQQCIDHKVDALFVHHGYFWKGESPIIRGIKQKRISLLMQHGINLFAYHLPIDAYEPWGNNACIAKRLSIDVTKIKPWNKQPNLLWFGALSQPSSINDFYQRLSQCYKGQPIHHVSTERKTIHRVAWCSGAGQDLMEEAIHDSIDAFISGEFSERTYYLAKEANVDFFSIGHHASERDGIKHLGEHLALQFQLEHVFLDVENPF